MALTADLEVRLAPLTTCADPKQLTTPAEWLGQHWCALPNEIVRAVLEREIPAVLAHGDLFPRNVLRTSTTWIPIDWEWYGTYPPGWDLATIVVATLFHPNVVDCATDWCAQHSTFQQTGFIVGLAALCLREAVGRFTPPPGPIARPLVHRGNRLSAWAIRLLSRPSGSRLDLTPLIRTDVEADEAAEALVGPFRTGVALR
jgi:hypothetical protein